MQHDQDESPGPLSLESFIDILDRLQRPLIAFVYGLVGIEEEARDILQDTFCAAWEQVQKGRAPFTTCNAEQEMRRWLFHVGYNRAVSLLRRRRTIRWESLETDAAHTLTIPALEDQVVAMMDLRSALAALSPSDAACLLLIVVQGFSVAEVATILDISTSAVAKRLLRAKQRLRAAYTAEPTLPQERSPR